MSAHQLIVVSGLAASGKTTVGRLLSERLDMPLIDKDVILESLFDSVGCDDRDRRYRLSRASDEVLYALAEPSRGAVLVNWWNHDTAPARLRAISTSLVEAFCDCPVEVAAARFAARRRHPGHLDQLRSPEEQEEGVRRTRETYPGPLRADRHRGHQSAADPGQRGSTCPVGHGERDSRLVLLVLHAGDHVAAGTGHP